MHDTTPLWLIAAFAIVVILFLIYMEMRHARKNPGEHHYQITNNLTKTLPDGTLYTRHKSSNQDPYTNRKPLPEEEL